MMEAGVRVVNKVPEGVEAQDDEVELTILRLGVPITLRNDNGSKFATFEAGTECAVLWHGFEEKYYMYQCILDTNIPVQHIGWHSKHTVTREIRKKDEQLKLLIDKAA